LFSRSDSVTRIGKAQGVEVDSRDATDPGTHLGPYEIVAPLGAGGMGEVYRARDARLGRDVAIKVLPRNLSASPEVRARFEREARAASSLNHPNICTLFDVGRDGDTDYLVMELVEGETLAARLAKGALPPAGVLRFGAQIADALDRAHRAGVIPRDVKPGNVMLGRSDVKLMDFGLARATGPADTSAATVLAMTQSPTVATPLTAEGTIIGTFQYMSPEQLEGKEADARSDLWALGCMLYQMAAGRRAFEGASQASLISSIMKDQPRPLAELAPLTPPGLDRIVRACLAKTRRSAGRARTTSRPRCAGSRAIAPATARGPRRAWMPGSRPPIASSRSGAAPSPTRASCRTAARCSTTRRGRRGRGAST
jgi:serine/threonine protein kinase